MPNWKKVIVSGSNAVLNNITSSGNINASGTIISNNKNVVSQSGAFTNNEFIIAVGDGAVTSSDALAVDSDGNLGIGIPNPEVRLHMLGEDAQTTQILMEQFNNTTDAPDIRTRRYRGTSASRADVQTGDYLFRLNVHGQDDGSSEVYGSMRFDVDSLDQDALEWGLQTRDTAGTVADRIKINSSGDSEFTSNITASGNISSSGTLQGASLKVDDGTNLLGGKRFITSDSKYEFRDGSVHVSSGHITASGNISASGTSLITAQDLTLDRQLTVPTITNVNTTHITASGNISASGKLTAASLNTGQGDYELYNMNQNVTTTSDVTFNNVTASLNLKVNGDTLLGNHESDTHTFNGHITASGNISSSGTITADTLTPNNIVFTPSATSIKIEAPDETAGSVNGAGLTIEAGDAFGSNFNGGDVTIQAGKGSGAGDGGNIVINAGGGLPSGSISLNAPSIIASDLPTSQPTTTGSLWLSGSNAEGSSKYLMVFTG
jgi:hypothetical protein